MPTQSSWLNLLERFLAELTNKQLRRGSFRSVPRRVRAISRYIDHHNDDPQPFVWSASASSTLRKRRKLKSIYETGHSRNTYYVEQGCFDTCTSPSFTNSQRSAMVDAK